LPHGVAIFLQPGELPFKYRDFALERRNAAAVLAAGFAQRLDLRAHFFAGNAGDLCFQQ
jgi:hypothetical protein